MGMVSIFLEYLFKYNVALQCANKNKKKVFEICCTFKFPGGYSCSHYCAQQLSRHISLLIYSRNEMDLVSILHTAFLEVNNAFARWFMSNHKGMCSELFLAGRLHCTTTTFSC